MEAWSNVNILFSGSGIAPLLTCIGLLGAIIVFIVNTIGAIRARRRDKASKAIEQLLAFESDPSVRAALRVMDYPGATTVMAGALKFHFTTSPQGRPVEVCFSEDESKVRDNFDVLLSRLELIEGLISHGIVAKSEFGDQFDYWLQLCSEISKPGDTVTHLSDEARRVLWLYIRRYHFVDVIRLFRRYGRAAPINAGAAEAFGARSSAAAVAAV